MTKRLKDFRFGISDLGFWENCFKIPNPTSEIESFRSQTLHRVCGGCFDGLITYC